MATFHSDEDELFGANLSTDFYASVSSPSNHRPWQSSPSPPLSRKNDREREPYELLDDVPPATNISNNSPHPQAVAAMAVAGGSSNKKKSFNLLGNSAQRALQMSPQQQQHHQHHYPVEELYPRVDDSGNGNGINMFDTTYNDGDRNKSSLGSSKRTLSAAAAGGYSPRPEAATTSTTQIGTEEKQYNRHLIGSSRYPIDDHDYYHNDGNNTINNTNNQQQRRNINQHDIISITESRSDSEISEYHPRHAEHADYYDNDGRREDNSQGDNEDESSRSSNSRFQYEQDDTYSAYSGFESGRGRMSAGSRVSVSSFDRLYNDEEDMEMDSLIQQQDCTSEEGLNNGGGGGESSTRGYSPGLSNNKFQYTPGSASGASSTQNSTTRGGDTTPGVMSDGHSRCNNTPMSNNDGSSTTSLDVSTPGKDSKWSHVKVDVKAPTPLRSNLRSLRDCRRPSSPYEVMDDASVGGDSSIMDSSAPPDDAPGALAAVARPPTPPRTKNRRNNKKSSSGDIFRIHGTDSCLSSKSGGISGGITIGSDDESMMSSSANNNGRSGADDDSSSLPSNDSAIDHLNSFQQDCEKKEESGGGAILLSSSPGGATLQHSPRYSPRSPQDYTTRATTTPRSPGKSPLSPYSPPRYSPVEEYSANNSPIVEENSPGNSTQSSTYSNLRNSARKYARRMCKEDPPEEDDDDDDFGYYYPQTIPEDAAQEDPEGYKQQVGLFPEIDLWNGQYAAAAATAVDNGGHEKEVKYTEPTALAAAATAQATSRYYEPGDSEFDYGERGYIASTQTHRAPARDPEEQNKNKYDYYDDNEEQETDLDMDYTSMFSDKSKEDDGAKQRDAIGFKSNNGEVEQDYRDPAPVDHRATISDDHMAVDSEESSEDTSSSEDSSYLAGGDISIFSEDSDIEKLRRQSSKSMKNKKKQKPACYRVKSRDSMESDFKIDLGLSSKELKNTEKKKKHLQEKAVPHPYKDIIRNDSMEDMMDIDFDKFEDSEKGATQMHCDRRPSQSDTFISPPTIQRRPFSFEAEEVDCEIGVEYSRSQYDDAIEHLPTKTNRSIVSDDTSSYSSDDSDDESEASNDPTFFPSKAISKMNLGHIHKDYSMKESEDLVEKACHHLSRGRNDQALGILNEALEQAQTHVDETKQQMDNFFFQKKRGGSNHNVDIRNKLQEDEHEDQLDSNLRNAASELANVLNNIGVVHELEGNYHLATNFFREALDAYRNQCHRYENNGDAEVDRTVSNIMQMGIAMRSHDKRQELHQEVEELAAQTKKWASSNYPGLCTQLRMDRLNTLMCVLDVEMESLGQNHPEVGFTLLKKGELHLEMQHVDMAIKDTQDGISLLKRGLGGIHPVVGLSLVKLADMYNYHAGNGHDDYSENKSTALSLYQEALTPLRESFGRVNSHSGQACNSIGILYSTQGESQLAMKSFYDALACYGVRSRADDGAAKGQSRPDVFYVWVNVGGLHMQKCEWQLALRSFLKAHSAFTCLEEQSKSCLQKIGPLRLMRHALTLTKNRSYFFDDSDTLVASLMQNIGKAQSELHQYGKAVETLEEALRIHQVVAMRSAGNKRGLIGMSSSEDIARILENLGEVQMISGDLTSAMKSYKGSLNLLRSNRNEEELNSIEVGLVLGSIGQVHLKNGEYAEAKVVLRESMRTFEKIGVPPTNRKINEIRSCLVDSELALMQNASSSLAGQRREISHVPLFDDKALAVDEIADEYRNKGDFSSAIWFYSEALAIRQRRVEQLGYDGMRESEVVDVGRTISNIAQLRRDRREFSAAKILFDEARELYKSVGLSATHPFARDLSQEIETMRTM